jgi:hypothetical protein
VSIKYLIRGRDNGKGETSSSGGIGVTLEYLTSFISAESGGVGWEIESECEDLSSGVGGGGGV